MPRTSCLAIGDTVYCVLNRSNNRSTIFRTQKDYLHFEALLTEARELTDMRILAYTIREYFTTNGEAEEEIIVYNAF